MLAKIKGHFKGKRERRVITVCGDCLRKDDLLHKIARGLEAFFVLSSCLQYKKDDKCPFGCSIISSGYPFKLCGLLDQNQMEDKIFDLIDRMQKEIRKEIGPLP